MNLDLFFSLFRKEEHPIRRLSSLIAILLAFTVVFLFVGWVVSLLNNKVIPVDITDADRHFWEQQIETLQDQLSTTDNRTQTLINLANAYKSLGQVGKADGIYKQLIKESPKTAVLYVNRADLHVLMGKQSDVESLYKKAIALAPTEDSFYEKLANYYQYQEQDLSKTRQFLESAVIDTQNSVTLLYRLAAVLEEQGDTSMAADYYNVIFQKNPDDEFAKRKYLELTTN